jgi:hypothetical protein
LEQDYGQEPRFLISSHASMSSEWWSILVVFWILFLVDGVRGGRRDRLFFFAWKNGRSPKARAVQASWHCAIPLPSAWTLLADDLPASFAPEGLTNWPSASAGRPPPLPESVVALRWEEIERVEQHGGWIHINGRRFTRATPALSVATLRQLARELGPLSIDDRTANLRRWHASRLAASQLRRRLKSLLARSQSIVVLNTVQVTLFIGLTLYLLLDVPARIGVRQSEALASLLPAFFSGYLVLHLTAVFRFLQLHRRYFPRAGQERASLVFTALFVPPQALRLRQQLVWKLAEGLHPLAVALAAGGSNCVHGIATNTIRDIRYPRQPDTLPVWTSALARSAATVIEPVILAQLTAHPLIRDISTLLAPPIPESLQTCVYCPRCGDQFTKQDARCAHGVPLVSFPSAVPERKK